MKRTQWIIVLSFLWTGNLSCQYSELIGTAIQFSGEELYIRQVSNPITGSSTIIDTIKINSEGDFQISIPREKPGWIFINSGLFRVNMFMEPGKGYEIELPPKTEKSEADIRNPFYQPVLAHMKVLSEYPLIDENPALTGEDINSRMFEFDTLLNRKNRELRDQIRLKKTYNTDSLIHVLEQPYRYDSVDYFSTYRKYRYGILKINSRDVGLQHIYENYLGSKPLQTDNPAFMELYKEMYKEFLFYYSRTDDGKNINHIINRLHNADALMDTLLRHPAIPDRSFAELLIIKEVFDIYNKGYFFREALLILLDSIAENPINPEHGKYALEVKEKLIRLKPGNMPPDFSLTDISGEEITLEELKGRYVYLNFCTPENYSCLKEFPFLDAIHRVHEKYLNIVTIMVANDHSEMVDFVTRNNYNWTFLFYGNNEEILTEYKVKAYPTCYLLDPDGYMLQSPAVLPTEGLEKQLFRIMRSRGDL